MTRCTLLVLALVLSACGSSDPEVGSSGPGAAIPDAGVVVPGPGSISGLDGGRYHTCLVTKAGAVYCWGQGAYGALGNDGSYRGLPTRALVVDDAIDVRCGGRFTCARRAAGSVFCWGEDQVGQLAGPDTMPCGDAQIDSVCAPVPQAAQGLDRAKQVALGANHGCALLADDTVACWGDNADGELGNADLQPRTTPTPVAGISNAVQVAAGDAHSCALLGSAGGVLCWGKNANGQVGSGAVTDRETAPIPVSGLTDVVEVAAGGEHTCARRANGSVACWGYDYFGQLGNGSTRPTRATSPLDVVGISDALQLALGRYHSCARRAGGGISCWGYNSKGELGDGTAVDRTGPVDVMLVSDAVSIAAGAWHTCAILGSGPVLCWGDDLGGQLGINGVNKVPNATPVAVQNLPIE